MNKESISHTLVVALLFVTAPSALAEIDMVSARNIGSDGLNTILPGASQRRGCSSAWGLPSVDGNDEVKRRL